MKRGPRIVTLVGIIAASLTVWAESSQSQGRSRLPPADYDIAGAWVGSSPPIPGFYSNPLLGTVSVTPTDPSRKRFAAVIQAVNAEVTFGGLFPDAERHPDSVATYVRSGPRTYLFTWIVYFVKSPPPGVFERAEMLYFWTFSGAVEFLDANTHKLTGLLSVYSNVDRPDLVVPPLGIFGVHDQDQDDDGFADEGELPFVSFADFAITFKRLPLMTP
jgi:hypothetical protein